MNKAEKVLSNAEKMLESSEYVIAHYQTILDYRDDGTTPISEEYYQEVKKWIKEEQQQLDICKRILEVEE